jgi:hypothetical protein
LLARTRRLIWLWVAASALGPVVFDLLRHTNASLVNRYALPGLPAAVLAAAIGVSRVPRRWQLPLLGALVLAWAPGLAAMYRGPARSREPLAEIAAHAGAWARGPADLVIVHAIPSGVVGVARYLSPGVPVAAWVPQLAMRRPAETAELVSDRCRVALVKAHDMGAPSPAEDWLRAHAVLERRDVWFMNEALYFSVPPPGGRSANRCPPARTPAPTGPGTPAPSARRSGG